MKWFRRGLAVARRAQRIAPRDPSARMLLGEIHALMNEWPKAIEVFDQMERDGVIPPTRKSAFYAWRAYAKHRIGADYSKDHLNALETSHPPVFADYLDALKSSPKADDGDFKRIPVAPLPFSGVR